MIFFSFWYMNETMSSKTPRSMNANILPPSEMSEMSKMNSFSSTTLNRARDMMRNTFCLCFMPSHINANEHSPQSEVSPALPYW